MPHRGSGPNSVPHAILSILLLNNGKLLKDGQFLNWTGLGADDFLTRIDGRWALGAIEPGQARIATRGNSERLSRFINSYLDRRGRSKISCSEEFEDWSRGIWDHHHLRPESKREISERNLNRHRVHGPPYYLREKIAHWSRQEKASFFAFAEVKGFVADGVSLTIIRFANFGSAHIVCGRYCYRGEFRPLSRSIRCMQAAPHQRAIRRKCIYSSLCEG